MEEIKNDKKVYTYDEAFKESLVYFNGDELASSVFLGKYALKDNENNILEKTPQDMHHRLAKEFSRIESNKFKKPMSEEEIFGYLDNFKYIVPQGSPMFGIGNNYQVVSLSNCYVVESPLDSYSSIMRTDNHMVQISKRRGGIGTDISHIRPAKTPTKNAAKMSTGIIPFMERYSNTIREVGQENRRGALILTLSIHHPESVILLDDEKNAKEVIVKGNKEKNIKDIVTTSEFYDPNTPDFCTVKFDRTKVTGANISLMLTREFLEAVEKGTTFEQRWPVDAREKGQEPRISKMVDARRVWRKIIHAAWQAAEPGLIMIDRVREYNAVDCYEKFGYKTTSTNPCSELPLCPLDSCRLLIQNLFSYVDNPFTKDASFNYEKFYNHARIAQRLMDDMIDLEIEKIDAIIAKINSDPEPEYLKASEREIWEEVKIKCVNGRRTGTGITAEGDMLAALGLKYGSDESIKVVGDVHRTQKLASFRESVEMAKELGPFPIWDWELEKDSQFLKQIEKEDKDLYNDIKKYGRRNIANLTIAPTGSVSLMTQTTSGVEPLFRLDPYIRRKKINSNDDSNNSAYTGDIFIDEKGDKWQEYKIYHPKVKMWMDISREKDIKKSPWYKACAEDIDWKQRVKLQAEIQKHIDHAISSTVNLPEDVKEERVAEIYETAFKLGCKGMTVYRDKCRSGVLVDISNKNNQECIHKTNAPKRPEKLSADVYHVKVKGEEYFVLVGIYPGGNDPYEIFAGKNGMIPKNIDKCSITKEKRGSYHVVLQDGKEFKDISAHITDDQAAITRLISTSLRHGADIKYVVHQLEKIPGDLTSFAKAISRVLKKYIKDGEKITGETCSSCGSESLVRSEGCSICKSCGVSKCG